MNKHCLVCNKVDRAAKGPAFVPAQHVQPTMQVLHQPLPPSAALSLWWRNLLTALVLIIWHGQLCASPPFFFWSAEGVACFFFLLFFFPLCVCDENEHCIVVSALMPACLGRVELHPTASQCGRQGGKGKRKTVWQKRGLNEGVCVATCSCSSCTARFARSRQRSVN